MGQTINQMAINKIPHWFINFRSPARLQQEKPNFACWREDCLSSAGNWDTDAKVTQWCHPQYRILATPASFCHNTCVSGSPHIHMNAWIPTFPMAFFLPTHYQKSGSDYMANGSVLNNPSMVFLHLQFSFGCNYLHPMYCSRMLLRLQDAQGDTQATPQPTSKHAGNSQCVGICTVWPGLEVDSQHLFK